MEEHQHHHHLQGTGQEKTAPPVKQKYFRLAFSATVHCLVGCGIGEVLGMIIGTALNLDNLTTTAVGIVCGLILGFLLGMMPLRKAGFPFNKAFRQVLIAEGLSIVVMETFEVLVQLLTPGLMDAQMDEWLFWEGMLLSLVAGFVAAFPVNYIFVKKGIRHQH